MMASGSRAETATGDNRTAGTSSTQGKSAPGESDNELCVEILNPATGCFSGEHKLSRAEDDWPVSARWLHRFIAADYDKCP